MPVSGPPAAILVLERGRRGSQTMALEAGELRLGALDEPVKRDVRDVFLDPAARRFAQSACLPRTPSVSPSSSRRRLRSE